jgi:DNA-binding transcriptional regulator YbjK
VLTLSQRFRQGETAAMGGAEERSTADEQERAAIVAAMNRVLSRETRRKLAIRDLAAEAGLDRYSLTTKHADLKDLFYERVREIRFDDRAGVRDFAARGETAPRR